MVVVTFIFMKQEIYLFEENTCAQGPLNIQFHGEKTPCE